MNDRVDIEIFIKSFAELTAHELYSFLCLRSEVFVVEQYCPYPDLDHIDDRCIHLWTESNGGASAYLRILPPDVYNTFSCAIGRVVVAKKYRGLNLGKTLMHKAIEYCHSHYPDHSIELHAQFQLQDYYSQLGFTTKSKVYLEDGMPHVTMELSQ